MTCGTTHTGVFATDEERNKCQELAKQAASTPVITISSNLPSFAETAWKRTNEAVYTAALAHGLPEIEGYYGMTPEGEFVRT
jgi:hypothetical protein